jgi:hypothetical protein
MNYAHLVFEMQMVLLLRLECTDNPKKIGRIC